jgi:hypothetical protein
MKNLTKFTSLSILCAVVGLLPPGIVEAAPQIPPPEAPVIVGNDGYLVLVNPQYDRLSPTDRLCAPGAVQMLYGECVAGNRELPRVTPQQALDIAYGRGKTTIVGYAPVGLGHAAIYYRFTHH